MNLNLFFVLLIILSVVCISIPNHIINTANCKRHWVAILTIVAGIIGIRGYFEISFIVLFMLVIIVLSMQIHKFVKNLNQIEIK